ncbi:MAG: hypothetical protein ACLGQH_00925 [Acidobacteriota bacterium]
MWIWVARWIKRPGQEEALRQAAGHIRRHWEEVCLDVGFDPTKNVALAESDKEIRVGISAELDLSFREEPGEWRYY